MAAAGAPIHHLNCGTMCPRGARLLAGDGGWLAAATMVCHCLLIEAAEGLVLVDTGFGSGDVEDPRRLGQPFRALVRPELHQEETARSRIGQLGFAPEDVRHIVLTHLDLDHAGGLSDFAAAEVHLFAAEHAAAMQPTRSERSRYIAEQWAHEPRWAVHDVAGDEWHGFESVRVLPGTEPAVLLIPLPGHTRGHTGVAVRRGDGWLLHCGDAYFHHREVETPSHSPAGLRLFQKLSEVDGKTRHANRERLRELAAREGDGVELICSHDPADLERMGRR